MTNQFNIKIDEIMYDHLRKDGFIGPESECEFKTIIHFLTVRIPELIDKNKKNEESAG